VSQDFNQAVELSNDPLKRQTARLNIQTDFPKSSGGQLNTSTRRLDIQTNRLKLKLPAQKVREVSLKF